MSPLLKAMRKYERKNKVGLLLEFFSDGTVSMYTFAKQDKRKYVRDFRSLIEVENWLNGESVKDFADEVKQDEQS